MSNLRYTTVYSYCDLCDAKINDIPYSIYCCVNCMNSIKEKFDNKILSFISDKDLKHINIYPKFLSIYGLKEEDITEIKLQAIPITFEEYSNLPKETLVGTLSIKESWIIFRSPILLNVAHGFTIENSLKRNQILLYRFNHIKK